MIIISLSISYHGTQVTGEQTSELCCHVISLYCPGLQAETFSSFSFPCISFEQLRKAGIFKYIIVIVQSLSKFPP